MFMLVYLYLHLYLKRSKILTDRNHNYNDCRKRERCPWDEFSRKYL